MPRLADKIHTRETHREELVDKHVAVIAVPLAYSKDRSSVPDQLRNRLFKSLRIGDEKQLFSPVIFHNLSYGRRPLDSERRLVVALLYLLARIRQKEHPIPVDEVIKVRRAVLGRIPVGKDYKIDSLSVDLRDHEPSGRKEQPGTERLLRFIYFVRKIGDGFLTY